MGRFAQRARRGGGGPGPSAQSFGILAVKKFSGNAVDVSFPSAATRTATAPTATFQVTAHTPLVSSQINATTIRLTFAVGVNVGDAWTLTGQPTWLAQTLTTPASGVLV